MIYSLITFIVLIAVLSLMRQKLIYELSGASLLAFGSTKPGISFYTFLFLPGTIIHELSHWIVAEILQVRTGEITIFPSDDDEMSQGERRLGSVATERTDPFRAFLIGLAPFISGLGILIVLGVLLSSGWGTMVWWQIALIVYGIVVIGNSMMISSSDRRSWPFIVIFFAVISILIGKYYPDFLVRHSDSINLALFPLNRVLEVTAGVNLVMIGGLYALRRVIELVTKKRIVHK